MSSADRFRDYSDPGLTLDENTIITDYWLDFVAVRQEVEEPAPPAGVPAERLKEEMRDFGHRIAALLEDQKRMRAQFDKFTAQEKSVELPARAAERNLGAGNTVRDCAGGRADFSSGRNWSLADRFRNSFLFTTIQKLR